MPNGGYGPGNWLFMVSRLARAFSQARHGIPPGRSGPSCLLSGDGPNEVISIGAGNKFQADTRSVI